MYNSVISFNNNIKNNFTNTVRDSIGNSMEQMLFSELDILLKKLEETYLFEDEKEIEIDRILVELRSIV